MTETHATILIPDISGFTEFMTRTELTHSSKVINHLLHAIVEATGDAYEVSEIEGDAVLMFRKGPAPSKKEILEVCMKIFNAFHYQKAWMSRFNICPCNTCREIFRLTLKFVVHHGPVGEIKVGRFVKLSGTDMIVAHRLMKNSIPSSEYLLLTDKLCKHQTDSDESFELEWGQLSDEFSSIGRVDYQFALLDEVRKQVPDPPQPETTYSTDNTPFREISIVSNFRDVYMVLMNIPGRTEWQSGLKTVTQEYPDVFLGSLHQCTFENFVATLSPLTMTLSEDQILFAESCRIPDMNLHVVHEYIFRKAEEQRTVFAYRILFAGDTPPQPEIMETLNAQMNRKAENLKAYCETMKPSFFARIS